MPPMVQCVDSLLKPNKFGFQQVVEEPSLGHIGHLGRAWQAWLTCRPFRSLIATTRCAGAWAATDMPELSQ